MVIFLGKEIKPPFGQKKSKNFFFPIKSKIEIPENLNEHFSKTTFYGLHAGNNLNLI